MPRSDFADPNDRTRVSLLTRADDLNLEIVLGVQYCADSRGSQPGLAACCGARVCRARPTLHLSKTPARLGQTGIGNGTEMPEAVKGVSGATEQEFEADFLLAETLVMSQAPCPAGLTSCRRWSPQRPTTPRLARAAWPDRGHRCPRPGCGSRGRDGCWRR